MFCTETTERFNAIIHAIYTSVYLSLYLAGLVNCDIIPVVFINSIAYTIYDLFLLYNQPNGTTHKKEFILHHVMMFLALIMNYEHENIHRVNLLCKFLLTEWSTIFLNLSIIIYKSGYGKSFIFRFNSCLTLLTYFIFRIVCFPMWLYETYQMSVFFAIMGVLFYLLNCIWFWELIKHHRSKAVTTHNEEN
jgi:hypothetical protein